MALTFHKLPKLLHRAGQLCFGERDDVIQTGFDGVTAGPHDARAVDFALAPEWGRNAVFGYGLSVPLDGVDFVRIVLSNPDTLFCSSGSGRCGGRDGMGSGRVLRS